MKIYKLLDDKSESTELQEQNTMLEIAKGAGKAFWESFSMVNATVALAVAVVELLSKEANVLRLSETEDFINATNSDWKINGLYAEHPRRTHILIPVFDYNDYIKREMVADIANYIMDHLAVKKLVIGIVASNEAGAEACISVEKINLGATVSCNLERDYYVKYESAEKSGAEHEYIWVDRFPDIKTAVDHKSKTFEVINANEVELIAAVNAAGKIGAKAVKSKSVKLYISYSCE